MPALRHDPITAGLEAPAARHPVGLFTNNSVRDASRRVRLPASRHSTQMVRMLETLAQLTHFTLMPLDQLLRPYDDVEVGR